METVMLSPKFQVEIPSSVRKSLKLRAGQKFQVFVYGSHIELVPVKPIKELRGTLKGLVTTIEREPDRV